jgi:hypothetical protein
MGKASSSSARISKTPTGLCSSSATWRVMSRQAVERVRVAAHERLTAGRPYVFPSDRLQDQPLHAESLQSFCSQVAANVGFPFVVRNLRTTFLTSLARLRVPQEVRRRLVNHSDGTVETIHYKLYDYDAEKWAAGLRWDAHLRSIFFGETARVPAEA